MTELEAMLLSEYGSVHMRPRRAAALLHAVVLGSIYSCAPFAAAWQFLGAVKRRRDATASVSLQASARPHTRQHLEAAQNIAAPT